VTEPVIKWGLIVGAALIVFLIIRGDVRGALPRFPPPGETPGTGGLGPETETKRLRVAATIRGTRTRTYPKGAFVTYGGPGIRIQTFAKVNEGEVFFHNTPQVIFFFGQLDVWGVGETSLVIDQLVRQGAI